MSDDGESAIVVIALLGNPFSPAYAAARARGASSPLSFSALNVALYARRASAWCLTEKALRETDRTATSIAFGTSKIEWVGDDLVIDIDERTAPFGRPVRGRVVVRPEARPGLGVALDPPGKHRWWPVAPFARLEVDLASPGLRFVGHGYHDVNAGSEPLPAAFENWHWARARASSGAIIVYDVALSRGASRALALQITPGGDVEHVQGLTPAALPRTLWGLARSTHADPGTAPRVVRELENGPFYSRTLIETRVGGQTLLAVHESLAAHRLVRPWVHRLVRFRMRSVA